MLFTTATSTLNNPLPEPGPASVQQKKNQKNQKNRSLDSTVYAFLCVFVPREVKQAIRGGRILC